jgi:hypothetical protein
MGVGCPTRDSDAQTQPRPDLVAPSAVDFFRVPAQIGQRRTR